VGLRLHIRTAVAGALAALVATGCGASDITGREADLVAGKQQFVEKCGACHTLHRAGTTGTQGPNLDEAFQRSLSEGFGRDGIQGAVHDQILYPARLDPKNPAYMPPKLVKGDAAFDVAAYVAQSVAKGGEDQGLLASAVEKAGGGEPAVEKNGVLTIPATAQLAYETNAATAKPGKVEIDSPNPSGTPHNIALEGGGVDEAGEVVTDGGISKITATLKPGEYTFFCTVDGHRAGGMEGKLTVK
jgi:plastocyanin